VPRFDETLVIVAPPRSHSCASSPSRPIPGWGLYLAAIIHPHRTVVVRKALREEPHRFAASELDPRRHPGVWAPMSSTPQHAPQIPVSPAVGAPEPTGNPSNGNPVEAIYIAGGAGERRAARRDLQ
jgi:hypothetical protein